MNRKYWITAAAAIPCLLVLVILFPSVRAKRQSMHETKVRSQVAESALAWIMGEEPTLPTIAKIDDWERRWMIEHFQKARWIGIASSFPVNLDKFCDPRLFAIGSTDYDLLQSLTSGDALCLAINTTGTHSTSLSVQEIANGRVSHAAYIFVVREDRKRLQIELLTQIE